MLAFAGLPGAAAAADDFLAPEQAFKLHGELRDGGKLVLRWDVAPGYHLYRERLAFKGSSALAQPELPAGVRTFDENFNKEMETYQRQLVVTLPVTGGAAPFTLTVGYQGCADAGLCYPPQEVAFKVSPAQPGPLAALSPAGVATGGITEAAPATAAPGAPLAGAGTASPAATPPGTAASAAAPAALPEDDSTLAQRTLRSGSLWRIGGAFLVFGLLLSFTPCVLPMVPILSSIIVGEGSVSRGRGLMLAAAYCLGMALVYTALGVGAGLAGEGLAGALQKPWVLLTFGALLVGLALSMFDIYQLQLPSGLQSRLSETGGRLRGGRFVGVFAMGALSALIVGPCVAGPLAGALLYISQTGNAWVGGWALFSMACGMSVPLLLTGLSAGSLLPRAGAWMNGVKKVFGLLLIAVAVWMVSPVFPVPVTMMLWGALAVLCAVFLHVGQALPAGSKPGAYAAKALGLLFLVGGLFELVGAASAGRDVLQPLAHLRGGSANAAAQAAENHSEPRFTRIRTVAELESVLATAREPVLLDFYADWCVACKEMERMTFSKAAVSAQMKKMRLIQVDVTANNADDRALMKKFSLFGPPGMILFDASGKEIPQGRLIGFIPPEPFVQHLQRAAQQPG
ncbi:protein-disulfide reductase [Massilia sp. Root418]|nr:protein-disulfide reductase [Massilia sp. Root418]